MKHINTYLGGLDTDTAINRYKNDKYLECENFRIISHDNTSVGVLQPVTGNTLKINLPNGFNYCGNIIVKNILVLFCSVTVPLNRYYILRIDLDTVEATTGSITLNATNYYHINSSLYNLVYTNNDLDFDQDFEIEGIGDIEGDDIIKIYWTQYDNTTTNSRLLRSLNIVYNADFNNLVTLPLDALDVIMNYKNLTVDEVDMVGGQLRVGKIQYSYQLYRKYGSSTRYSIPTNCIHIGYNSDTESTSLSFVGAPEGTISNKGIKVTLDTSDITNFNHIKIIAIHYTSYNNDPEIRVCYNGTLNSTSDVFTFIDNGISLDTLTLSEFRLLSSFSFTPRTINAKDNILFAANIQETYFDVDFDARAYRFLGDTATPITTYGYNITTHNGKAVIYGSSGDYYVITRTGVGTHYNSSNVADGIGNFTNWNVPETFDCINKFNDPTNDGNLQYACEFNAGLFNAFGKLNTLGGTGKNVSFQLTREYTVIDSSFVTNAYSNSTSDGRKYGTKVLDGSYSGQEGYKKSFSLRFYKGNETYRFGLVLFNTKGQVSFPKWICDIRFPGRYHSTTSMDSSISGTEVSVYGYTISFTVNGLDDLTDVTGFQIVRLPRYKQDRMILGQGIATHFYDHLNTGAYLLIPTIPNLRTSAVLPISIGNVDYGTNYSTRTIRNDVLKLIVPECLLTNDVKINTSMKLRISTGISPARTAIAPSTVSGATAQRIFGFKYLSAFSTTLQNRQALSNLNYDINSIVELGSGTKWDITPTVYLDSVINSSNVQYPIKNNHSFGSTGGTGGDSGSYRGPAGSGYAVRLDRVVYSNPLTITGDVPIYLFDVVDVNKYFVQYGGFTYSARTNNEYIPCSDYQELDGTNTYTIYSKQGDTYITMFSYLYGIYDQMGTYNEDSQVIVNFIAESPYLFNLRHDKTPGAETVNALSVAMQEKAGTHSIGLNDGEGNNLLYTQLTDLYLYNEAYSREPDALVYISKPQIYDTYTNLKNRIRYSESKVPRNNLDNWLSFLSENKVDIEGDKGDIISLIKYNNTLFAFQQYGICVLAVNERALTNIQGGEILQLGTGGVLDYYKYLPVKSGIKDKKNVVSTDYGIFWYDHRNNTIYRFTDTLEEIAVTKSVKGYLNSNIDFTDNVVLGYDNKYKEILFSIGNKSTLVFNCVLNQFTGVYTYYTNEFISFEDMLFAKNTGDDFYLQNTGDKANFFGSVEDSKITIVINPNNTSTNLFTNFKWISDCEDNDITISAIRLYNEYQDSGLVSITSTTDLIHRLRQWKYTIRRAEYDGTYFDSKTTGTALIETAARFRSTVLIAEFYFDNTVSREFKLWDIMTSFINSNT
jgi:hypothetical protein